jgi:MoxR-like ATPase
MKQKIQTLLGQLNHGLVEREATLKMALLTVLAGENLVLIGPPGTGKSLIARRIAESLAQDSDDSKDNAYFEYLLTKFSTPEEIFGPLSITELKADRYKRNTAGYLPTVKIAFLDEIFKASSSILNALLTILNERIYHNGAERQAVNLQALIAASNELPTNQEELSALYDRFLVRSFVDYVTPESLPLLFANAGVRPKLSTLTIADLDSIAEAVKTVTIPPEVQEAVLRIWAKHKEIFKEDRRESLSDRRLKKVIHLLSVSAATNGRSQVDLSDVFMLRNCLWNHQENAIKVKDLILNTLHSFSRTVPQGEGTAITPATLSLRQADSKLAPVVKGFKGSGTEQDPLLVESVDELMDLSRPEVGLKGYYFRQIADIDCTSLTSWTKISFKGHYDGGGHAIKYKKIKSVVSHSALFSDILTQSSITNLKLDDVRLATKVADCHISHCLANGDLIEGNASDCIINACQLGGSLILDSAINCTITACESASYLVLKIAQNCIITDCLVVGNWQGSANLQRGGIASALTEGCTVKRCFVTGTASYQGGYFFDFSGVSLTCYGSSIEQCALGKLVRSSTDVRGNRIVGECHGVTTLKNNASIDSNNGHDDINGRDGKTVAAALFKQRYFEHTLDWDFDTVWQWDNKEDRPALRSVGLGANLRQVKSAGQDENMVDLLTQQIRANIWL